MVANWKDDIPSPREEFLLSIVCGNSHLHWCLHEGQASSFSPTVFWRTPPLEPSEYKDKKKGQENDNNSPCRALTKHLPNQVQERIFGTMATPNPKELAARTAATREVPAISIYLLSTNKEHEEGLKYLFKDICHRMILLKNKDFLADAYETLGDDRAATLYASRKIYGEGGEEPPVLVFDGGTAMTYTAMNRAGVLMGGGISLGMGARFHALSDYTGALPHIAEREFLNTIQDADSSLLTFSMDTKQNMMGAAVGETMAMCRRVVKEFVQNIQNEDAKVEAEAQKAAATSAEASGERGSSGLPKPLVVVTGGDHEFLAKLLKSNQQLVSDPNPFSSDGFELKDVKYLIHHAVAELLKEKAEAHKPRTEDDEEREKIRGLRVAKEFAESPDYDMDHIYRGSVISVVAGKSLEEDLFAVRYDDGDSEHLDLLGLYSGLELYSKKGEKPITNSLMQTDLEEKRHAKKEASSVVKARLYDKSEKLRKDVAAETERKKVEKEKAAVRAAAGTPRKKRDRLPSSSPKQRSKPRLDKAAYNNQRIAKIFTQEMDGMIVNEVFFGTIQNFTSDAEGTLWHVIYDDDDQEDFDEKDLKTGLALYEKKKKDDPKLEEITFPNTGGSVAKPGAAPTAP